MNEKPCLGNRYPFMNCVVTRSMR